MLLSFKTALIPNNKQITSFRKASGVARHAYNWANAAIVEVLKIRETDSCVKIPSAIDLHKRLVAEVKSQHKKLKVLRIVPKPLKSWVSYTLKFQISARMLSIN